VIEEQARAAMWIEVTNKNIWEDYVKIKRARIRDCIHHRRYPKELEHAVWEACVPIVVHTKNRVFLIYLKRLALTNNASCLIRILRTLKSRLSLQY
jgi:hypothetical protein